MKPLAFEFQMGDLRNEQEGLTPKKTIGNL